MFVSNHNFNGYIEQFTDSITLWYVLSQSRMLMAKLNHLQAVLHQGMFVSNPNINRYTEILTVT